MSFWRDDESIKDSLNKVSGPLNQRQRMNGYGYHYLQEVITQKANLAIIQGGILCCLFPQSFATDEPFRLDRLVSWSCLFTPVLNSSALTEVLWGEGRNTHHIPL